MPQPQGYKEELEKANGAIDSIKKALFHGSPYCLSLHAWAEELGDVQRAMRRETRDLQTVQNVCRTQHQALLKEQRRCQSTTVGDISERRLRSEIPRTVLMAQRAAVMQRRAALEASARPLEGVRRLSRAFFNAAAARLFMFRLRLVFRLHVAAAET
eukprot:s9741_g1.t1